MSQTAPLLAAVTYASRASPIGSSESDDELTAKVRPDARTEADAPDLNASAAIDAGGPIDDPNGCVADLRRSQGVCHDER
jgi:hypothetical protein